MAHDNEERERELRECGGQQTQRNCQRESARARHWPHTILPHVCHLFWTPTGVQCAVRVCGIRASSVARNINSDLVNSITIATDQNDERANTLRECHVSGTTSEVHILKHISFGDVPRSVLGAHQFSPLFESIRCNNTHNRRANLEM
jgi:hypothetical protein